jgi:nucleotide-binding universal stress UspA family protein
MDTSSDNTSAATSTSPERVFQRVLVGVDGSPEGREAARQAALLLEPEGELTLLSAWEVAPAVASTTGFGVPTFQDEDALRKAAEDALESAAGEIRERIAGETKLVRGTSYGALLEEAERGAATLIAVGSHGTGRARGIVVGSTATELVHNAPCSVLVARGEGRDFSRRIVVGLDGSPSSVAAYAIAQHLAARFGAELWPVMARGGKDVDERLVATVVGHRYEGVLEKPVPALVAAAADADLLVVGSRGLHGLGSLGSVSERVAHQASSSVLIVRDGDDG